MPRRTAARYSAPALEKGLDVLELLASQPHALSLQEIAQRLGRSSAELYRMLDVLVQRGWLARLPDASYGLTLRLFELAHRLFDQFGVVAALNVVYLSAMRG
jgi:DNA-binding IclR family transcriptional regulator